MAIAIVRGIIFKVCQLDCERERFKFAQFDAFKQNFQHREVLRVMSKR